MILKKNATSHSGHCIQLKPTGLFYLALAVVFNLQLALLVSVQHDARGVYDVHVAMEKSKQAFLANHRNIFINDTFQQPNSAVASSNPSLAIVSTCIPGERFSKEYIDVSHANKRQYCEKYNATCILPTTQIKDRRYHKKWDKLYHIVQTLRTRNVDWVLWMDCDAAFTNFDIHWYAHLEKHLKPSKLMVVSKDKSGINLGVFLVPNTKESQSFISELYDFRHILDNMGYFQKDQAALGQLMKRKPHISSKLEIVDQQLLNTYLDNDSGKVWSAGDFIVHQVYCLDDVNCSANFTTLVKQVTPKIVRNDKTK